MGVSLTLNAETRHDSCVHKNFISTNIELCWYKTARLRHRTSAFSLTSLPSVFQQPSTRYSYKRARLAKERKGVQKVKPATLRALGFRTETSNPKQNHRWNAHKQPSLFSVPPILSKRQTNSLRFRLFLLSLCRLILHIKCLAGIVTVVL